MWNGPGDEFFSRFLFLLELIIHRKDRLVATTIDLAKHALQRPASAHDLLKVQLAADFHLRGIHSVRHNCPSSPAIREDKRVLYGNCYLAGHLRQESTSVPVFIGRFSRASPTPRCPGLDPGLPVAQNAAAGLNPTTLPSSNRSFNPCRRQDRAEDAVHGFARREKHERPVSPLRSSLLLRQASCRQRT